MVVVIWTVTGGRWLKRQRLRSIFRHPKDWEEFFPQFAVLVSDPSQFRLGLNYALVSHLDRLYYARDVVLGGGLVLNASLRGFKGVSESALDTFQGFSYIVVCSGPSPWVCLV